MIDIFLTVYTLINLFFYKNLSLLQKYTLILTTSGTMKILCYNYN